MDFVRKIFLEINVALAKFSAKVLLSEQKEGKKYVVTLYSKKRSELVMPVLEVWGGERINR